MTTERAERLRARLAGMTETQRRALAQALGAPEPPRAGARLVAYVTASGAEPEPESMADFLRERLPAYMVPDEFVVMDELPRSRSGKLDRKALRERRPESEEAPPSGLTSPRTETERILAEIWKAVLDVDEIDVYDDFFELGGDSILSIRVIARANEAGLGITPHRFFESPTIADLAVLADESAGSS